MNLKTVLACIGISAVVSAILIFLALFYYAGITVPLDGSSYGLTFEMFRNSEFVLFHLRAWLWLFSSAVLASLGSYWFLTKKRHAQ